jgi:hypothetical protein
MTMRDIFGVFDKDPRSKEELRKELRERDTEAARSAGQVQHLKAAAAIQEDVQSDLASQNQQLKVEATTREKVLSDLFAQVDAARHANLLAVEDKLTKSTRRHAILLVANSLRQLLTQRLASNLLDSRQEVVRFCDEATLQNAQFAQFTNRLAADSNQIKQLEARLLQQDDDRRRLEARLQELSDQAIRLELVEADRRVLNGEKLQLETALDESKRMLADVKTGLVDQTQLQARLDAAVVGIRNIKKGLSPEGWDLDRLRARQQEEIQSLHHDWAGEKFALRNELAHAIERCHKAESFKVAAERELDEARSQVGARAVLQATVQKLREKVTLLEHQAEAAAADATRAARKLRQEQVESNRGVQSHLQTIELLKEELAKTTQAAANMATLSQIAVLSWMFSDTTPETLAVTSGNMQLMGDGPWPRDEFGVLLQERGFHLWDLPAALLVQQIEARAGLELRIYSQEMWFGMMATGRDPFDADDDDLLLAFGQGHPALEFLMRQEPPWPVVSPPPADDDEGEILPPTFGVSEAPPHVMGYKVGKSSPYSEQERREILTECFKAKALLFADDCTAEYRKDWGTACSARRLSRLAWHIKAQIDGRNGRPPRRAQAREDWISDLQWLKTTYFKRATHNFQWPDSRVR